MSGNAQWELNSIRAELRSIINELNLIAADMRNDFSGIANGTCANRISDVATFYGGLLSALNCAEVKEETE